MELLNKEEYRAWLEHPVTQGLMKYCKHMEELYKEHYFKSTPMLETIAGMNQLYGRIEVFKLIQEDSFYEELNIVRGEKDEQKDSI